MISAKIVADSITTTGDRLTTLEVVMPRYILAEFNTHRMLSKNSASSRAIPFSKMVKSVQENPFIPYAWQKDHKGMQGTEYETNLDNINSNISFWQDAQYEAITYAKLLNESNNITKQLANRLLEPFMYHKVLVSGTEWENFFNLRCPQYVLTSKERPDDGEDLIYQSKKNFIKHNSFIIDCEYWNNLDWLKRNKGQADIHMMFLAEAIYDARNENTPNKLKEGEWHIPYGNDFDGLELNRIASKLSNGNIEFNEAINQAKCKISIARCARLSYKTLGDNPVIDYEKDLQLYEVLSKSGHWSPFEHIAKVMTNQEYISYLKGNCEFDETNDRLILDEHTGWCRNFKGFIQYRELLDKN